MTNQGIQGIGQSKIIVFGAGGRVGRAVVAEARARGHEVTEAGRGDGDVTSAADVARLSAGHDAAVAAVYDTGAAPGEFFPAAARALAAGLGGAGVRRLVSVGLASVLPTDSGALLMDTPGYPQEWREFYVGHGAGTEALRAAAPAGLDWAVLSPSGDFSPAGTGPGGGYAFAPADAGARIPHADFARAVLDEVLAPTVHRTHAGVTGA
ncbi:NAD(P)H-binding protein [Streptomyces sp. NBC_00335]|uniref:NAD(P)-dependent oxidoreductase n=1 Tax=unclassified Streptomyces TaxID=2593676 RepID=UPI00225509E9|nr:MULTISPECIES: NAD(P)H-binding protein [unclassified Streptomyces]MCX5406541.1 NAD(P)H-binding protein [Streptomyces sp. NBC_00086]